MKAKARLILLLLLCGSAATLYAQGIARLVLNEADIIREHQFGISVALQGDELLVGSVGDTRVRRYAGAVHVFQRRVDQWVPYDTLRTPGAAQRNGFGTVMAVEGGYALFNGDLYRQGAAWSSGSVFVFKREGGRWRAAAKIIPPDTTSVQWFGRVLALRGPYAFVGAYKKRPSLNQTRDGVVYVFERVDDQWIERAQLTAPYTSDDNKNDSFGQALCATEDLVVVGAPGDESQLAGAAYVFERDGVAWTLRAQLTPSDGQRNDRFGSAMVCSDESVFISSYRSAITYLFQRTDGQWAEQPGRVTLPGGPVVGCDALVKAWHGNYLFLMAWEPFDGLAYAGFVYVFKREGARWALLRKMRAPDASEGDGFGQVLAMDGDWIVIGAPWKDTFHEEEGAVYVIHRKTIDRSLDTTAPPPTYVLGFAENYPNPFSQSTTIRYSLPAEVHVRLQVYDALGRQVATLVNERQGKGVYERHFDGGHLPGGVYFLRLYVDAYAFTRTMLVQR